MARMPDVALTAVPGRRRTTLDLAKEIERCGFGGVYCPSFGDGLGLCEAVALETKTLRMGTSIANIYLRLPADFAATAAFVHEVSEGRFTFGIGVSHGPTHEALGITPGKPLSDTRRFVEQLRAASERTGPLPPVVLATLRDKMVDLASEIAEGAVWANGARSYMAASLSHLTPEQRGGIGSERLRRGAPAVGLGADATGDNAPNSKSVFYVGNMVPTCIDDDRNAAANVMRRTLTGYVSLPNYRNYWTAAGYGEEMEAIKQALEAGERDRVTELMTDRWLSDVTLYGSVKDVREGVEAWHDAGVNSVILVPSSTKGGQLHAFEELFAAFA